MMFFWLAFLFLIPFAIVRMAHHTVHDGTGCCSVNRVTTAQATPAGRPDPIDIARRRLALGEITPSEYEEIRRVLG